MARHVQQGELPLVRARIPLVEEVEPVRPSKRLPLEDTEEVHLRVPTAVAKVVTADPAASVKALAEEAQRRLATITEQNLPAEGWPANEDPEVFTNWETEAAPKCIGFWDVTDHKSGTLNVRWWFGGVWWTKGHPDDASAPRLSHDQFKTQYAWRGLRNPPPDAYPCPPYRGHEAPVGIPRTKRVAEA